MNSFNSEHFITFSNFLLSSKPELQRKQIIDNLTAVPRSIPSKFLYDKTGSMLYNKITLLPDYYLTNLEMFLIDAYAKENREWIYDSEIVDIGCGSEKKINLLLGGLGAFESILYTPLDVSEFSLNETAVNLVNRYPGIHVHCIAADFMDQLHLLPESHKKRIICFFGSTIGNLSLLQRCSLLREIRELMNSKDLFLLGVDMVKKKNIMEKAYNDPIHLTALFNRNILNVINSLIQTDFDPFAFEHVAFYNEQDSRIEMHLKAIHEMAVTSSFLSSPITLKKGEMIHTENSHKFTIPQIISEIESAGLHLRIVDTDRKNYYALLQIDLK